MPDARLRTAESDLLGLHRVGDVDGWEIPGRYLAFLRGGPAEPLADVVRHNDQDVRSLAWLLAHLEGRYADPARRSEAPPGDLAGLARAFARERRLSEALACLDAAADRPLDDGTRVEALGPPVEPRGLSIIGRRPAPQDEPWWSPRRPPDFGGRPRRPAELTAAPSAPVQAPWTAERIAVDRAHLLRRLGRHAEAAEAWSALAAGPGRVAVVALIELAKLRGASARRSRGGPGVRAAWPWRERASAADGPPGTGARGRPGAADRAPAPPARAGGAAARRARRPGPCGRGPCQPSVGPTDPTCVSSLGTTARRIRSLARRTSTAARSGTADSPGPSTASDPAAAAKRRSGDRRDRERPTIAGRRTDASRAARNVSPAPVGSVSRSVAVGR